jgi:hypothetical protein
MSVNLVIAFLSRNTAKKNMFAMPICLYYSDGIAIENKETIIKKNDLILLAI